MNDNVTRSLPDGLPMTEPLNPQEATLTSDGLPITVPMEQTHGESLAPPGFILERELGKGGMGVVTLAHQTGLNRPVAIKMLLGSSSNAIIRFLAEAQAIAAVRHPNIVEVYQFGTHNNQPFLAMEYCTGGTLAERLKAQGKFKPRDAAELMAQIADGVEAAHAQGIVHRDLKPGNVLIGSNGEPKVCDFGLAKLGSVSDLTETGVIMGTPAYMPPEQARGDSKFMLPAGDVWALGVILYEMVTGQKPFKGDDNWSLLNAITEGRFEQPRSRDGTLPKDLELIILKCLQPEPPDRYGTAGKLAEDLRNWLEGRAIVARPPGKVELAIKLVKRNPAVSTAVFIATLALLVGTGVSLWQANRAEQEARRANGEASLARTAEKQADDSRIRAEQLLYAANIQRAQQHWASGQTSAALEALDAANPVYRGWEHDYLWTKFHQGYVTKEGFISKRRSFSPDGKRIAWGEDAKIEVKDSMSGRLELTLSGHLGSVECVMYSPDSRRIVSGSKDKTVKVWNAITGLVQLTLKGHSGEVHSVAFSPNGRQIVSGSSDKTVKVWDAATGLLLFNLEGHTQWVDTVSFSPEGTKIVSGSSDNTVKVWDAWNGKQLFNLQDHSGSVWTASFSPDGRRIVSGSQDQTLKVWDANTGQLQLNLQGHTGSVWDAFFSWDGKQIYSGSRAGFINRWDAVSGQNQFSIQADDRLVSSVAFSPDGKRIVSGGSIPAKVWDATTGQKQKSLSCEGEAVTSLSFSPDGLRVIGSNGLKLKIWNVESGEVLLSLDGHTDAVISVSFNADGTRIVSGSHDKTVKVWNTTTGALDLNLQGHTDGVTSVSFSPDGKRIASGSVDHTVKVWDAFTGQELLNFAGHSEKVLSVAFSPDGKWIASACLDRTVKVWDATTGMERATLIGHASSIFSLKFSPDGKRIVSGSRDLTIKVWDAYSGQMLLTLASHKDLVSSVSFSADGRRLISGSLDGTIKIWDGSFSISRPEAWEAEQQRRLREWDKPNPFWHAEQALDSEKKQQWFAALFHLRRLVQLNQFNPTLPIRLAIAESNWFKQSVKELLQRRGYKSSPIPLAD